jgi:cytoskeletal protein CcmA (bactofilin family)
MPRVYDVWLETGSSVAVGGEAHRGQDFVIDGQLAGGLVVVGRRVVVGPTGRVRADIHAESIVVEGEVEGDVHGSGEILVTSCGAVTGQLIAPSVTLEQGARFQGSVETRTPLPPRPKQAFEALVEGSSSEPGISSRLALLSASTTR